MLPEPYPWCLACGFQHLPMEHCADCTGDHSAGFCMTPEAAAELARLDTPGFRRRVERDAARLHAQVLRFLGSGNGR
jgi:hypothetical protein